MRIDASAGKHLAYVRSLLSCGPAEQVILACLRVVGAELLRRDRQRGARALKEMAQKLRVAG
jgi:hypothetical protein